MKPRVCIVGAGLAGGVIASELAREGYAVTLVEIGRRAEPLIPADELWNEIVPQAIFTRGMGLGGTANFWHGGLVPLDPSDVDSQEPGRERAKSPLPYEELLRYYERSIALMRGRLSYSLENLSSRPDPNRNQFEINQNLFRYKGLLYPKLPFSSASMIVESRNRYGLRVIQGVDVKRVVFSDPAKVVGIDGIELETNGCRRIETDVCVLSAGGIGSPRILLDSVASTERLRGLPIGKFLIDHPTGFVFKAKLRKRLYLEQLFAGYGEGFRMQYGFALRPDQLHIVDGRNHVVYLRPATSMKDPVEYDFLKKRLVAYKGRMLSLVDVAYLLKHRDLLFDALNFKFGLVHSTRYVSGLTFAEQFPSDGWEIRKASDGKFVVNWGISSEDQRSLDAFVRIFLDAHADVFESVDIYSGLERRLDTACHHSGGCRMGWDSDDGVVDSSLRVFGTDNLYVADGSVIRYSGCANTGLTICALALKCCDSIRRAFS